VGGRVSDILDLREPRKVDRESARVLHIRGILILEAAFEALTIRSLRRVLKTVSESFGAIVAAAEDDPGESWTSFDDLAAINAGWATEIENELVPALADTYAAGAQSAGLAVAGSPEIPEFVHDQAVEWMYGAKNRLFRVSDDVWTAVRNELTAGVLGGESVDQLKRRVRQSMETSESRARTVARTEVIGATNAGSFFQAKALGVGTKTWLATDDRRTRRSHDRAEGQEVGLDEAFEVGGAMLRFPHDPNGPAKETVNCRCTMLFDDKGACMCVPGWAQAESGERLVAAATSNCACSEDPPEDLVAAGTPTAPADATYKFWDTTPETFAEDHTGAMVALVPADPEALAIEGGDPVEELHTTMFYLGEAADIPTELQAAILAEVEQRASTYNGPLEATIFGAAMWNPNGDEPSLVWNVGGPDLAPFRDDMRQALINAPDNVDGDRPDWSMPEQHQPWAAHLCAAYGTPEELFAHMAEALDRVGPVVYDRVRVAYGPTVRDFPLGGNSSAMA
jgi:SPP1 gp7 family putative phage head morphogenesis protein